jgi:cysteine-rich repeat protein
MNLEWGQRRITMRKRGLCGWQCWSIALLALGCTAQVDLGERPGTGGAPGSGEEPAAGASSEASGGSSTEATGGAQSEPDAVGLCGDGRLDRGEQCDDANTQDGDGCSADCTIMEDGWKCPEPGQPCVRDAVCGNGILEHPAEQCDDGNTLSGDGCSSTCLNESMSVCGNGIVEDDEQCDDGLANGEEGNCTLDCMLPGLCGNGKIDGREECDDGNTLSGDGCSKKCTFESVCGNGVREGNEQCDNGPSNGVDGTCTADCMLPGLCGNGKIDGREECDDGNTLSGDGCSKKCRIEAGWTCARKDDDPTVCGTLCGDGIVSGAEECDLGADNGATYGADGCTVECTIPPFCGDGTRQAEYGEECDNGSEGGSGCTADCKLEP